MSRHMEADNEIAITAKDRLMSIERDIKQVITNDLPHIDSKLISMETNQKWIIAIIMLVLGAVIAGSLANIFT